MIRPTSLVEIVVEHEWVCRGESAFRRNTNKHPLHLRIFAFPIG